MGMSLVASFSQVLCATGKDIYGSTHAWHLTQCHFLDATNICSSDATHLGKEVGHDATQHEVGICDG